MQSRCRNIGHPVNQGRIHIYAELLLHAQTLPVLRARGCSLPQFYWAGLMTCPYVMHLDWQPKVIAKNISSAGECPQKLYVMWSLLIATAKNSRWDSSGHLGQTIWIDALEQNWKLGILKTTSFRVEIICRNQLGWFEGISVHSEWQCQPQEKWVLCYQHWP